MTIDDAIRTFKQYEECRFQVGYRFIPRGKNRAVCTVTDILRTYNLAGQLTRIRYVVTHELMGQTITDIDCCETTVAMGEPA